MRTAGRILVALGLLVMGAGSVQLFLATALSTDPNPNPVGNGVLFALCWTAGLALTSFGIAMSRRDLRRWI